MTAVDAQSMLFRVAPEPPAEDPIESLEFEGVRFELSRTGHKVSGDLHLDRPNPFGRSVCRVEYIRRVNWPVEHEAAAVRIAAHWFKSIGGLALIRNHQLCHVLSRLRLGHGEKWIHVAIDSYAVSKFHRDNKAWCRFAKFFMDSILDVCLERSEDYANHQAEVTAERIRNRTQEEEAAHVEQQAGLPLIEDLSDGELRRYCRAAVSDVQALGRAAAAAVEAAWNELPKPEQERRLRRAAWDKCETRDWRKAAVILGGRHGDLSCFHDPIRLQAFRDKCRREGQAADELVDWPTPTQPYNRCLHPRSFRDVREDSLRHEAERRACADAQWLLRRYPRGLSRMAFDVVDALRKVRCFAWLDGDQYDAVANNEQAIRAHVETDHATRGAPQDDDAQTGTLLDRLRRRLEAIAEQGRSDHAARP